MLYSIKSESVMIQSVVRDCRSEPKNGGAKIDDFGNGK